MSMSTTTSFLVGAAALAALCGGNVYGVETQPVDPGQEVPEAQRGDTLQGSIITVDQNQRTIQLERQKDTDLHPQRGDVAGVSGTFELIELGQDAQVMLDGKQAELSELQEGDKVTVQLQQQQPGQEEQEMGITLPEAKMVRAYREQPAPFEQGQQGQQGQQHGGMGQQ
jgi:hypothetical protein